MAESDRSVGNPTGQKMLFCIERSSGTAEAPAYERMPDHEYASKDSAEKAADNLGGWPQFRVRPL
jgi:hypothetical protein